MSHSSTVAVEIWRSGEAYKKACIGAGFFIVIDFRAIEFLKYGANKVDQ